MNVYLFLYNIFYSVLRGIAVRKESSNCYGLSLHVGATRRF